MSIQSLKLGAAALLAGALLAGPAQAQTAAPAAPAGQPAPAQQNPNAPVKVDLKTYDKSDWLKLCPKMPPGAKDMCMTTRDYTLSQDQPPIVAVALYDVKGKDTRDIRILLPTTLMLKPGIRLSVDKGQPVPGSYTLCMANGCFAETELKGSFFDQMKTGTTLNIIARGPANNEVTFTLPITGFGKAVDGPAVPQEVIQKQQQDQQAALQAELQKRAEAQRKALEQQSAPAAAPAAAAPAPAPAKP